MELIIDQTGIMNLRLTGGRPGYGSGPGSDGVRTPADMREF